MWQYALEEFNSKAKVQDTLNSQYELALAACLMNVVPQP